MYDKIICVSMFIEIKCFGPDDCSNQGICDVLNGTCTCDPGFQGDMCQGKTLSLVNNCKLES